METSRLRDFKIELSGYVNETVDLMKDHEAAENISGFEKTIREKLSHYNPSLMFYGVYNAGKSTILNAIFGKEKASVADVPETHEVTEYQWKGYRLVDTPGINGPERDYQISSAEMVKHDVIMFVIDDSEDFDKRNVTQEVIKIIKNNKPLIIVLNNKQIRDTEEEDEQRFNDIRVKFFANLKKEADFQGITHVEERYSFIRVNGDSAVRGKLHNSLALIKDSHIDDLELLILQKLKEMDGPKILHVPADIIIKKISELQEILENQAMSNEDRELLEFISELITQKSWLYQSINQKVKREIYEVSHQIYNQANQGKDAQPLLLQLQKRLDEMIQQEIKQTLKVLGEEVENNRILLSINAPELGKMDVEGDSSITQSKTKTGSTMSSTAMMAAGVGGLGELSKKVAGSTLVKAFPSIILPKAPIPPVVIGEIILKVVSWFIDNKRKQRELEEMKRQVAEANAKQEEMVNRKIAMLKELNTQIRLQMYKYEEEIMENIRVALEDIFGNIEENVKATITTISETREAMNQRFHRLRELKAKIEAYKLSLEE